MNATYIPAQPGWQLATYSWFERSDEVNPIIAWKLTPGRDPEPVVPDPHIKAIADGWAIISPDGLVRNFCALGSGGTLEEWIAEAKAWGAKEESTWKAMSIGERGSYMSDREREQQDSLDAVRGLRVAA